MKKVAGYMLAILMLIVTMIGASAEKTEFVIENPNYLTIAYPLDIVYEKGVPTTLSFQVFNTTGIILDNTTTSCNFALYNHTGGKIIDQALSYLGNDFYITLNSTVTDYNGETQYYVRCDDTVTGGFVSANIYFSPDNNPPNDPIYLPLIIFVIIGSAYVLIMNQGRNIEGFRRFTGATVILLTCVLGGYKLALTNHGLFMTMESFLLIMIGIIYFVIQLGIILRKQVEESLHKQGIR